MVRKPWLACRFLSMALCCRIWDCHLGFCIYTIFVCCRCIGGRTCFANTSLHFTPRGPSERALYRGPSGAGGIQKTATTYLLVIFYPFSQICEICFFLLSLQKQPKTYPNLFQRGVEYGKYELRTSAETRSSSETSGILTCAALTFARLFGACHA